MQKCLGQFFATLPLFGGNFGFLIFARQSITYLSSTRICIQRTVLRKLIFKTFLHSFRSHLTPSHSPTADSAPYAVITCTVLSCMLAYVMITSLKQSTSRDAQNSHGCTNISSLSLLLHLYQFVRRQTPQAALVQDGSQHDH